MLLGIAVTVAPSPKTAVEAATSWQASHTLLLSSTSSSGNASSDAVLFNQVALFATTGEVPKRAAAAIGYNGEPAALAAQVTVDTDAATGAVRITTTQSTAEAAVRVANAFADQLTTYLSERQDKLQTQRLASTLEQVDSLEKEIKSLQTQILATPTDAVLTSRLDALSRDYSATYEQYRQLQVDKGQLQLTTLERAQAIVISKGGLSAPTSRSSRGVLGGIVGFIAGIGVALMLARSDRRIRTRAQAEGIFGLRSQVAIPDTTEKNHGIVVVPNRHEPLSDAYRTLRSVVGFVEGGKAQREGRVAVILVVSAASGDAKTSVATNLAAAFVETGVRTVAVNTDFRRPSLSPRILGKQAEDLGFTTEELVTTPIKSLLVRSPINGLVVLDMSATQASPGDLARITAARIPELTSVSASAAVVDTSPVGATAEVLELVPLADVIVLTVRVGHTYIDAAHRTIDTIKALTSAPMLLVVVGEKPSRSDYYEYANRTDNVKQKAPRTNSKNNKKSKTKT